MSDNSTPKSLPWRVQKGNGGEGWMVARLGDNTWIMTSACPSEAIQTAWEDGEYLVHCANSHERLVEALREMVNDEAFAELLATIGEEPSWLLKARAALDAEKEQERGN